MTSLGFFQTTGAGSFPHLEGSALSRQLATSLDIPCWPQLPRLTFRENMYVQFSASLPAVRIDEDKEKISFDTTGDLSTPLERFYAHYLADDLDAFSLEPEYATGFYAMIDVLKETPGEWAKGQVTGPVSFGLTVTDQDLRASLYNDLLADAIVKNMALNARWQIQQLQKVRPNTILFVDEPYMAAFGSAFISLSQAQATALLNEVFDAIHQEGSLAGVHCCANTDWSTLLATTVDILNLDAYGYIENLALYPAEVRRFLDRGGVIAWGIVPNNENIHQVTTQGLTERLRLGMKLIHDKAQARGVRIDIEELAARSLLTTSCGLGSTSVEIADRSTEILTQMGKVLGQG